MFVFGYSMIGKLYVLVLRLELVDNLMSGDVVVWQNVIVVVSLWLELVWMMIDWVLVCVVFDYGIM